MDLGKNAYGMTVGSKYDSFCYVIPFFINTFCRSARRAITNDAKRFKFTSIQLCNITVIRFCLKKVKFPVSFGK